MTSEYKKRYSFRVASLEGFSLRNQTGKMSKKSQWKGLISGCSQSSTTTKCHMHVVDGEGDQFCLSASSGTICLMPYGKHSTLNFIYFYLGLFSVRRSSQLFIRSFALLLWISMIQVIGKVLCWIFVWIVEPRRGTASESMHKILNLNLTSIAQWLEMGSDYVVKFSSSTTLDAGSQNDL